MPVEFWEVITRDRVRANRDKVFLFGDNLAGRGYGGQAGAMRGELNAIGIPTKKLPSMGPDAFFSDDEYEENVRAIEASLQPAFEAASKGITIVIPRAGIGTGRAQLQWRAPRTFAYLQRRLRDLVEVARTCERG